MRDDGLKFARDYFDKVLNEEDEQKVYSACIRAHKCMIEASIVEPSEKYQRKHTGDFIKFAMKDVKEEHNLPSHKHISAQNYIVKHFKSVEGKSCADVLKLKEDEEVLFDKKCKLHRFDTCSREWKDNGEGSIKMLRDRVSGVDRILICRDKIFKDRQDCIIRINFDDKSSDSVEFHTISDSRVDIFRAKFEHNQIAADFTLICSRIQKWGL